MLKQITVFLENKAGRMEDVTGCLAKNNINLHALSIADTTDFGILRMIVSESERAAKVLKENDFIVKSTEVIAVALDDSPGSLHKVLYELKQKDISIEYLYAFTSRHKDHNAIVILSLSDQDAALARLADCNIPVLGDSFLAELN